MNLVSRDGKGRPSSSAGPSGARGAGRGGERVSGLGGDRRQEGEGRGRRAHPPARRPLALTLGGGAAAGAGRAGLGAPIY